MSRCGKQSFSKQLSSMAYFGLMQPRLSAKIIVNKSLVCSWCCAAPSAVENALYAIIEADPSSRRLMIRNVPYTTAESALRQTLEAHGDIEDFKLVIDRNTGAHLKLPAFHIFSAVPFPAGTSFCCFTKAVNDVLTVC